jgi:hypothetical protein
MFQKAEIFSTNFNSIKNYYYKSFFILPGLQVAGFNYSLPKNCSAYSIDFLKSISI